MQNTDAVVFDIHDGENNQANTQGRKCEILTGSQEETLLANWMEQHCGFRMTTLLVNENRRQEGK